MPMRLVELLRVATGAAAIASCTVSRAAGDTLVTARPAPVPVNSMFLDPGFHITGLLI